MSAISSAPSPARGGLWVSRVLGAYLLAAVALGLLAAITLWPSVEDATAAEGGGADEVAILPVFPEADLSAGQTIFVFLVSLGVLGAGLSGLRAFAKYKGTRTFENSWAWWYLARPAIGAGVAPIAYWALRTGIVGSSAASTEVLDPYGIAVLGAIAGLFSRNVLVKLGEVIDVIFGEREGSVAPDAGSTVAPGGPAAAEPGELDRPPPDDQRG